MMNANYMRLVSSMNRTVPFANTKSLLFDGVDEYVNHGVISALSGASSCSVSIWMKDGTAVQEYPFGFYEDASNFFIFKWQESTDKYWAQVNTSGTSANYVSATGLSRSGWHNMVVVYDGALSSANAIKLYYDGTLTGALSGGTSPSTLATYTGNFQQGAYGSGISNFGGNLDELAVFDYALTSGEASTLYNSGTATNLMDLAVAKRPEHYWRNGDGSDTITTINDIGQTGGKDGSPQNMESGDIVSDAP